MVVSNKMRKFAENSTWISKLFEDGAQLKADFGEEQVLDFRSEKPDVPPPAQYDEILIKAAKNNSPGVHAYMPNGGYPWVKEILAKRLSAEQELAIEHDEMLVTGGAAGGLNVALKALLNPGEEVIVVAPYFAEYGYYIDNHGGVMRIVKSDDSFNVDLGELEAALSEKTKAIIINSPNNPSGQIYSKQSLVELGQLLERTARKFNTTIFILADESYRKVVYDNHPVPAIMPIYTNSIIIKSHSVDLSLSGQRIGYLAVHPQIADKAHLLGALTLANRMLGFVNAPALMQRVVAELQDCTIDISIYARRKDLLCEILKGAGYEFIEPKGALYVFPKTPIADDVDFVSLLQNEKILTLPGKYFGCPGYMRVALNAPEAVIKKSADGFKRAFNAAAPH